MSPEPFRPWVNLLDKLFQYEEMVEIPSWCSEFLEEFQRLKTKNYKLFFYVTKL